MRCTPDQLLTLIDAYAEARAHRDTASSELAAWAFAAAHETMLDARQAVADAIGAAAAPLTDDITRLAEWVRARDAAHDAPRLADAPALSDAQLDGVACVRCGDEYAPMRPVGFGPRGQVFACSTHADAEDDARLSGAVTA